MRPLAVLIAIVFGSAVSLTVGLSMTWIVLLFLPEHAAVFAQEKAPLLRAIALFMLLTVAGGASLYAELRLRPWRRFAHTAMVAALSLTVWVYWPR
jgi:uncharacterized membrane protein YqgA involved in biofilm formation